MKKILLILISIISISIGNDFKIKPEGWISISAIDCTFRDNIDTQIGGGIGWLIDNRSWIIEPQLGFGYFKPGYDAMFISGEINGGKRINDNAILYGIVGYRYISYDNKRDNSDGFGLGTGINFDLNQNWSLSTEYKYYDMDENNIITLKILYRL